MPNPYKYTKQELEDIIDQWWMDNFICWSLKEFFMYETRFTSDEFDAYCAKGKVPPY